MNLRNREYCIENRQVSKAEFETAWQAMFDGSRHTSERSEALWQTFKPTVPHRSLHNSNAVECQGDYLINCERAEDCYKCIELRDAKRCQYVVLASNDVHDISCFGESLSYSYNMSASGGLVEKVGMQSCAFGAYIYYGGSSVYYSIHCLDNCQNLFGCCDLNARRYCILNREYSRDEYERLAPKIIEHMRSTGEWGEFFPASLSPFAYNETPANDHFPLTQEQAEHAGFRWRSVDSRDYMPPTRTLPDSIFDISDAIVRDILACNACGKNYRLTLQELQFYRQHGLPAPTTCPDCRYHWRIARRNPQKLWQRACSRCHELLQTSYSPDRPEKILCERCYQAAVY